MLLPPQVSLIYLGDDQTPEFVQILADIGKLTVFNKDPKTVGTYNFMIKAIEPRFGFTDTSVSLQVIVSCLIEDFMPVVSDKTVQSEIVYVIRGGLATYLLPGFAWKPADCANKVIYSLAYENGESRKYPSFFKVDLDTR